MKPVARFNSSDTKKSKDTISFFSFRRPKSPKDHRIISEKVNKAASIYTNESLINIADVHNDNAMDKTHQVLRSPVNSGLNSVPFKALQKPDGLGIKVLINSDTFSQTKKLLYTDHQKSTNHFTNKILNSAIEVSPTNSFDSLNSSNDPDIAAALDRIASKMGLIDEQLSEASFDPVNYILATRSFSERLSFHKQNTSSETKVARIHSLIDNAELSRIKLDIAPNVKVKGTPVAIKKEFSFRKIIQHFSPKSLRRTRSSSPTVLKKSLPNINKHSKEVNKESEPADVRTTIVETIRCGATSKISNELDVPDSSVPISQEITNEFHNIGSSKRIYNSLRIDRVKCPYNKFMTLAKQRTDNSIPQGLNVDHHLDVNYIGTLATELRNQDSQHSYPHSPSGKNKTPSSPRYINISLSAFGYDPIGGVPFRKTRYQEKDFRISNTSEEYSSIENDINHK